MADFIVQCGRAVYNPHRQHASEKLATFVKESPASMLHSKISYSHLNARQTSSIEATIQAIITSMLV